MIKRWLLTSWNTEPFQLVTLALTIAPADSGTWERQDMTEGTKRGAWNSFCESTHIVIFRSPDWDALNDQQRCSSAGSYSWPGLKGQSPKDISGRPKNTCGRVKV